MPTATPRPDDDNDDDEEVETPSGTGGVADGGGKAPVFFIGGEELETANGMTASVTVATLNVREGPGTEFPVIGSLVSGTTVSVLARSEDNTWWYICCVPDNNQPGWTSAALLTPDFDRGSSADLIPVYGAVVKETASAQPTATLEPAAAKASKLPLVLTMSVIPPYLQQGETGEIVIEVSNPNLEAALSVEMSDQLPLELELIEATAEGRSLVNDQPSEEGSSLVLVRWESIPAGESVRATIKVKVADGLEDGAVFDNLAGVRGTNAAYASGAVTIGMPPVLLPDFQ